MGVRVTKKIAINMGMAGRRISGKNMVKLGNGHIVYHTQLEPGHPLDRIINRLGLGSKKTEPDGVTYQGTAAQPKTKTHHNRVKGTCQ